MGDGVNPSDVVLVSDDLEGTIKNGNTGGRRARGRMAGNRNTGRDKLTMAEMKARMGALYKDGVSYVEIADTVSDEFGLEGSERFKGNAIHYHIKGLKDYWRAMGLLHIDERQSMILARYDQLEMLCMEAYFASCAGSEVRNYEKQIERARSKDREEILREQIRQEREARRNNFTGDPRLKDNPKFQFEIDNGELEDMMVTTAEKIKEYKRTEEHLAGDASWVKLLIDINDKRAALWGLKNKRGVDNDDQERARLTDEQRDERLAAVLSAAAHRRANISGETNLAPPSPLGGFAEGEDPNEQVPEPEVVPKPEPEPEPVEDEFKFDFSEDFWK
jgi:hypothetical protein